VTVTNGGQLSTIATAIGSNSNSFGAATVTGSGSQWTIVPGGGLSIGLNGSGALTVSSGGAMVSNAPVQIGTGASGSGFLTVTGSSSVFDSGSNALIIGSSGEGHLTISGGGTVNNGSFGTIGSIIGSSGDVTITGADHCGHERQPIRRQQRRRHAGH